MSNPKRLEPVSDAEYGRQRAEAQDRYVDQVDALVAEHYPNADGAGVLAIEALPWQLICSAPKGPGRVPTIPEVERLAAMADRRQADRKATSVDDLFAMFPRAGA